MHVCMHALMCMYMPPHARACARVCYIGCERLSFMVDENTLFAFPSPCFTAIGEQACFRHGRHLHYHHFLLTPTAIFFFFFFYFSFFTSELIPFLNPLLQTVSRVQRTPSLSSPLSLQKSYSGERYGHPFLIFFVLKARPKTTTTLYLFTRCWNGRVPKYTGAEASTYAPPHWTC